jgi:hypothetical protein
LAHKTRHKFLICSNGVFELFSHFDLKDQILFVIFCLDGEVTNLFVLRSKLRLRLIPLSQLIN